MLALADSLKTAPTREMIASPAVLGNIAKEKVSELAVTVARDIMNPLQEALKRLGRQVSPIVVYIGLGLIAALLVYVVVQVKTLVDVGPIDVAKMADDVAKIKASLGVK